MDIVKKMTQASPWLALISFLITVVVATMDQWSAQDLAWSFWLAGLIFGVIYLIVYHWAQGDRETLIPYLYFWLFFYLLFAGFLDHVFTWSARESGRITISPPWVTIPAAIAHAAREQWPFLLTSGIALLPDYILDARTVHFTDWSKPLIGRDLLRMVALIFLLVILTLLQSGIFALYAVLFIYFLPWDSVRQLARMIRNLPSVLGRGRLGLLALIIALSGSGADAAITVDATQPGAFIPPDLWGSNITQLAPAADTVNNPAFAAAARQIRVRLLRWPGGNNADAYDWKRNELIKPGRRAPQPDGVDMARILQFARDIGAELSITVNFGTMRAQDAADLVEFLNGPADSPWGAQRAAMGFPDPIGVRFFEIGNEENQPHMWRYAWTAENPVKYFFGGEEERRGFYDNSANQDNDPVGAKGDVFQAAGGPNQTYALRFPPVRDVRVLWAATREDAENHLFEEWRQVEDLSAQPPDARVFTLEGETGALHFGDGVHGAMPPAESFFLVEYTTYDHDGFLDFARAMRAAPSNVPIQIGAAMLPFQDGQPIADAPEMQDIFAQMDFYVRHQYDAGFPVQAYGSYDARRQMAADRVDHLAEVYARVQRYQESIGMTDPLAIGVTEWNIFLHQEAWRLNRTLEGGVIAAAWFMRLLNAGQAAPVAYANQFALPGGNLSLIRSQTNDSIAPMGYVFQGFASWPGSRLLPVAVNAPEAQAYDRTIPYVTAAAALSPDGRTLRLAAANNAENQTITAALHIQGFAPASARLWRLTAPDASAGNDRDPFNVVLQEEPVQLPLASLTLPAHSVAFVELQGQGQQGSVHYLPLMTAP